MGNARLLVGMLSCAVAVTACTPKTKASKYSVKVDTNSIMVKSESNSAKAEQLALAAEQLLSPGTFMYADTVAKQALSIDSSNKRAQLIRALLKPQMYYKGVLTRIKPLMSVTAQGRAQYQKIISESQKWPNHALKTFLFDGHPDIKTEADAQKYVAGFVAAMDQMRLFFKNNKDLTLTLHVPGDLWTVTTLAQRSKECDASNPDPGIFVANCDYSNVLSYKINRVENEVAQQAAAGMEIYPIVLNAYRADGTIDFIKANEGKDTSKISNRDGFETLLRNKAFGTLRDQDGFKKILSMGLDFVSGARWAEAEQKSLCPTGDSSNAKNRPGYILNQGICVQKGSVGDDGQTFDDILNLVEVALRGGVLGATYTVNQDGNVYQYETQMNFSAVLNNSVRDIRDLGPFTWDAQGDSVTAFGDKTLGGIFVNGDGNKVIGFENADLHVHVQK